jgi:Pvc16 N-terminal domain
MSNVLSIAAVTAVLKVLLENGLVSDPIAASVGDVIVTALPPDRISVEADERAQINLFLYQVTQNRNVDWVSQEFRSRHSRINGHIPSQSPPLALDLHYLLTAYGAKDFQAELLLGYAMHLLHKTPAITSDIIESTLINASTTNTSSAFSQAVASLSVSDLAEQIGQIKLTPEFFNMEETSKLWSALQTHYRPSATYLASMVLIESSKLENSEGFYMMPLSQPSIEQVMTPAKTDQMIVPGTTLVIRGKRLRGEITRIRLSNTENLIVPHDVKETQISLLVPSDLSASVQGIQVVHLTMGNAGQTDYVVESNVAAFVLHPTITAFVAQVENSGDNLRTAEITVKFQPKVGKAQRVVLLLNEASNKSPTAYSFLVAPRNEDTDAITIPVKNIKPGTYIVRVQVDGSESPLHKNQSGDYDSPEVTIL